MFGEPLPSSLNPRPDGFPAALASREYEDIPRLAEQREIERARRRIGREVLNNFWLDIGFAHASAAIQSSPAHCLRAFLDGKAEASRANVLKMRQIDEEMESRRRARRAA